MKAILCVLCVLLAGCKSPPALQPRKILTDPEGAYVLDLLNLRGDQPLPPPP